MERLKLDFIQLNKALKTLETALNLQKKQQADDEVALAIEDCVIQRFEYTYDSFWKFLKRYLQEAHHQEDVNSPKKVFHACVKLEIFTAEEGETFIDMADDRNDTSHRYSIEASRDILSDIPRYYLAMVVAIEKVGKMLNVGRVNDQKTSI